MQQRVGLARCLAVDPRCILMDEPFSSIDYRSKENVMSHFLNHLAQHQSKAILVTHDLEEAARIASSALIVHSDGKVKSIEFDSIEPDYQLDSLKPEQIEQRVSLLRSNFSD